jgi:DNA (cytosine-5)-methyltransferase 1
MRGIDLFSGGGCGSAGARHAGLTMVAAADAWDIAARTYQDNFREAEVVITRLRPIGADPSCSAGWAR